jgi:hypothetical protein
MVDRLGLDMQGQVRFIATNPDVTRPSAEGLFARDGLDRGSYHQGHWMAPAFRRQAESDDVPQRAEPDRGALGEV